ncbi:phosphoribosyltransferase [Aquamicrobium sp. LC103]|uniref:phosphoribosyltransferase n=1 Tax=Aquamicrobium sp. LC103 TaxID=1120658 RepID=UPI00197DD43D|nr:phosphoribosyltransferase [Aquamicrobium sp. LC103]
MSPHQFWQEVYSPGSFAEETREGYREIYPATLPDGRVVALPVRVLPGNGARAVASLIVNQASFAVEDTLAAFMAEDARRFVPDIVVGVPTLGLPVAANVARRLGHARMVALGTSRKFWYDERLSEPLRSITSPNGEKRLYLDPRMLPLLEGRRFVVIDDVASTGSSLAAVLRLLHGAGLKPQAALFAMLQGERWRAAVAASPWPDLPVLAPIATPLLTMGASGLWKAAPP